MAYQYEPLGSRCIRVLEIQPSSDESTPLHGCLKMISLDSGSQFEAVSYVWGSDVLSERIIITAPSESDSDTTWSLAITHNCHAALQALRLPSEPRCLWIDALCINQSSTNEKNQQVPLMAEVYSKSRRVLIWLNAAEQSRENVSSVALVIRKMGLLYRLHLLRPFERDEQSDWRMPKETRYVMQLDDYLDRQCQALGGEWVLSPGHLTQGLNKRCLTRIDAFTSPFRNAYFSRVWTLQEIAMAHDILIHYGHEVIAWPDFVVSALYAVKNAGFVRYQQRQKEIFRDTIAHWDLLNCLESHLVLPDIHSLDTLFSDNRQTDMLRSNTAGVGELALFKARGLDATDPKDKAYAMLWAFADDTEANSVLRQVDYRKPVEAIFTEFSAALWVKTNGSTLQFYCINSRPRNPDLPSWVPDWAQKSTMSNYIWTNRLREYRAAREDSLQYRVAIDGPVLHIDGAEVDTVWGLIRLTEHGRQRDLHAIDGLELREALLDTSAVLAGLIQVGRSAADTPLDALLASLHRVVNCHKDTSLPAGRDAREFYAQPREAQLARERDISIGLLRFYIFEKLAPMLDGQTIEANFGSQWLHEYLEHHEIDHILEEARSYTHLAPFLAVVVAISAYIDLYRWLNLATLDWQDMDFFITRKKRFGVAFTGVVGGDIVAVWQGCPSPMLVRRVSDGDTEIFRLHGPAFVDGLMEGEGWPGHRRDLKPFTVV